MSGQPRLVESDHSFSLAGGLVYLSRGGIPVIAMRRSDFYRFIFDGMRSIKEWDAADERGRCEVVPLVRAG